MLFKKGDNVKIKDNRGSFGIEAGMTGRVILPSSDAESFIGVEFKDDFGGHNLSGEINNSRGYWVHPEYLELVRKKGVNPVQEMYSI